MHSSHYESAYIHHNGGFDGDMIISDFPVSKDEKNYNEIRIDSKEFFRIVKKIIKNKKVNYRNDLDVTLNGKNPDTDKPSSIKINSMDMVDLYLEYLRYDEISKLEQMEFKQLLKRYTK